MDHVSVKIGGSFQKLLQMHTRSGANVTGPTPATRSAKPAIAPRKDHLRNAKSVQQLKLSNIEIPNDDIVQMPEISESDGIQFQIEKLKVSIEQCLSDRQNLQTSIAETKAEIVREEEQLVQLRAERKVKERTHLVLENPDVNYSKMMSLVENTQERIGKLKEQWDEHRGALTEQLEKARQSSTKKYVSQHFSIALQRFWCCLF